MRQIFAFFAVMTAVIMAPAAQANGPWDRKFQDVKMPSQAMLEHYSWAGPVLATAANLKLNAAISSSAATTITTFLLSGTPDFPRAISLTPTGTTSNVAAGTAVVSGTNIFGKAISENFTIASTQSTATTGAKAFKTVTSVVFPQASGSSVTLSIGVGSALGITRCSNNAGDYVFSEFDSAYETTRGTFGVDSTHVESNTFTPHGTMDGSKVVDLFYVQNFRCYGN